MHHLSQVVAVLVGAYAVIINADTSCTSSTALAVENLSANANGPGGVSNSAVIALGKGLTKASIQTLKRKRDDSGGGVGGHGGGGGGNNGGIGDNLDCSSTGSGTETCYSVLSIPFCYSWATGSFHALKISGNAQSGNYTLLTGQTGNLYTGPYPTPTGEATVSRTVIATSTEDHGSNGHSGGSDDSKTKITTSNLGSGTATQVVVAISTTVSGISTTFAGIFTTTLPVPGTSTEKAATVVVSTTASSATVAAGAVGQLESSKFGFLGIVVGLFLV